MVIRFFYLTYLCIFLLTACCHGVQNTGKGHLDQSILALDHPLSTDSPLTSEDLPGNDGKARSALFHRSDASPAILAWRLVTALPGHEQHPKYGEILTQILLCQENLEAALFAANTRIQDTASRFRAYWLIYQHLKRIGKEEKAEEILKNLHESFSKKEQNSTEVQIQWLSFHHLENNYPSAIAYFYTLEKQARLQIPDTMRDPAFFHKLRSLCRMAFSHKDAKGAEAIARFLEKLADTMPESPDSPEEAPGNTLEHTYSMGKEGKIQPGTSQNIARIQVTRIYADIGDKKSVWRLYQQIMEAWDLALGGTLSGKSFEVWLPSVAESLYIAGFKTEALALRKQIPPTFPFTIHPEPDMPESTLALLRSQQRRYNIRRPPFIQRNLSSRLLALMATNETEEELLAFIQGCPDQKYQKSLLTQAIRVRLEADRPLNLLRQKLGSMEIGRGEKKNRHRITMLLQTGNTTEALALMQKERLKWLQPPWTTEHAKRLGDLALLFHDSCPSIAEELMGEALDLFEKAEKTTEEAASGIQHLALLCRKLKKPELQHRVLPLHEKIHRLLATERTSLLPSDSQREEVLTLLKEIIRLRLAFSLRDPHTRKLMQEYDTVSDTIMNPKFRQYQNLLLMDLYIQAGWFQKACRHVDKLHIDSDMAQELFQRIRQDILPYTAFPEHPAARFDTDGDGNPDFFSPLASPEIVEESPLTMDSDSDGDGIPDIRDRRPWFPDSPDGPVQNP